MTTATGPTAHDFYDPDAVVPQNSPTLVATKVNTRPSPSPELDIPLVPVRPSQGDAVLVGIMGNGRDPDIAAQAGMRPLLSDEEDVTSPGSDASTDDADDTSTSPDQFPSDYQRPRLLSDDLNMLAANALATMTITRKSGSGDDRISTCVSVTETEAPRTAPSPIFPPPRPHTLVRSDRPQPVFPTPYSPASSMYTPRTGSLISPTASLGQESLPPIQNASPGSESSGRPNLPSIKDQLGAEALSSTYAHSPPGPEMFHGLPRLPAMSHASPPISPHELNPRSPHQHIMPPSPYAPWIPNNLAHRHSIDYTSGNAPSDQSVSAPAISVFVAERMSIERMACNNQGGDGQYVCHVDGCKAPPFQTQYLLNSHANVHSQSRPHYCPVKNCPRAEGGKGFKRKNEMIRHGLVHESPGYVCPFCPDREHKYPRPDNLQRHVRVHHPDKDKDDIQLRDVLSQRPDGPSRGRRRRGAS